ncbi:unnamed protein product [Closterium sp. NIES-64]|nr:unnamed protein product [Closterium sp. NIES-64]
MQQRGHHQGLVVWAGGGEQLRGGGMGGAERRARRRRGGGGRRCVVLVTCEDTGCGIAEEEQRDVFQAFMQTRAHGGSGISLHLCQQLVSHSVDSSTSIGLLSTEGHGTTLHVALPMPVAAATAAAAVCGSFSSGSANVSGPQAICADDEAAASRAVGTKSARDGLKELLQGKAILLIHARQSRRHRPSPSPPSISSALTPSPPCLHVVDHSSIHHASVVNPSLKLSLSILPCTMHQVVDHNAIVVPPFSSPLSPPPLYPLCAPGGGRQLDQPSHRYHPSPPPLPPCGGQVVDDNLINHSQPLCIPICTLSIHQVVAASTLARYGAEVALAESGEAALRLLQATHSFHLVLMDLLMPGLDGFQTTAGLRALEVAAHNAQRGVQGGQGAQGERGALAVHKGQGAQDVQCMPMVGESGVGGAFGGWQRQQRVHVVAMSADVDSTVAAHAAEVGMDGAVQKPLNERVLLQVLSTLHGL